MRFVRDRFARGPARRDDAPAQVGEGLVRKRDAERAQRVGVSGRDGRGLDGLGRGQHAEAERRAGDRRDAEEAAARQAPRLGDVRENVCEQLAGVLGVRF